MSVETEIQDRTYSTVEKQCIEMQDGDSLGQRETSLGQIISV